MLNCPVRFYATPEVLGADFSRINYLTIPRRELSTKDRKTTRKPQLGVTILIYPTLAIVSNCCAVLKNVQPRFTNSDLFQMALYSQCGHENASLRRPWLIFCIFL